MFKFTDGERLVEIISLSQEAFAFLQEIDLLGSFDALYDAFKSKILRHRYNVAQHLEF